MNCKNYSYLYYTGNKEKINLYRNKNYIKLLDYLSKQKNSLEEIKLILVKYKFSKYILDEAIYRASLYYNRELIKYLIKFNEIQFGTVTLYVIEKNDKELIDYLIDENKIVFSDALAKAIECNREELIEYIINRSKRKPIPHDFNLAFYQACIKNDKKLVEFCINKGANTFNLGSILVDKDNKELLEYLKEKQEEYINQN